MPFKSIFVVAIDDGDGGNSDDIDCTNNRSPTAHDTINRDDGSRTMG